VPSFYEALEQAFARVYGEPFDCPAFVRFGSWVGGDMDGNPNVGAATIKHTLERHSEAILRLYVEETRFLAERLSQGESRARFCPALRKRQRTLVAQFAREVARMPARHRDMP
jgi:phosphoenolpyruvate carboxylase